MDANKYTLVFLTGWGFKASIWNGVASAFNQQNIITLDLPNVVTDLDSIVDQLSVQIPKNSIIIGWSLGGSIAIYLCHKYADLCRHLILISSTPKFISTSEWPGISQENARRFFKHAKNNFITLMQKFISLVQYPDRKANLQLFNHVHLAPHKDLQTCLVQYLNLLFTLDLRESYRQLRIPILHINGKQDAILPDEAVKEILPLNKYAKNFTIISAGHIAFITHQNEFVKKIFEVIEQVKRHDHVKKVKHCFNRAVTSYDNCSKLQQKIGNSLINKTCLHSVKSENILDLGCGTGVVTKRLASQMKYRKFYAIDIADQLLLLARQRLKLYDVKILEQDFQNLMYLNESFDLVFANMSLHWSNNLKELFTAIHEKMNYGGMLAFSLPLEKTFQEINFANKHNFYCQKVVHDYLLNAGFEMIDVSLKLITVNCASALAALKSIKAVGANYTNGSQGQLSQKKISIKHLLNFKNNKDIFSLTYQIGYFLARKI